MHRPEGRHGGVWGAIRCNGGSRARAKEVGGRTIGILPGRDRSGPNPYIDVPVVTGMGDARNVINILTSDVIIAVNGGPGALSEIALALKNQKHVVGLKTWHFHMPDFDPSGLYVEADTAQEAVDKAFERVGVA